MKNKTFIQAVLFLVGLVICWAFEEMELIDSS